MNYYSELNKITNVSRETFSELEEFANLVLKWNQKINLVSKKITINELWERHIIDSAQLIPLVKEAKIITDFGSGGGFPGVVLAILTKAEVNLVESDERKCAFLREASSKLPINIKIHNNRIEKITPWQSDVLTARALASMEELFKLLEKFVDKSKFCIFLKGQNVVEEIKEASRYWDFDYKLHPSITDELARVVCVTRLNKIGKESSDA